MSKIENKHYSSKYNLGDLNHSYSKPSFSFKEHEIDGFLNPAWQNASVFAPNIPVVTEVCRVVNGADRIMADCKHKLSSLRDYVAQYPPIQKDGNSSTVLAQFDELVGIVERMSGRFDSIVTADIISKAKQVRTEKIDSAIRQLEIYRDQEMEYANKRKEQAESYSKGILGLLDR